MASWTEVVRTLEGGPDHYRHQALRALSAYTGRNVIQYYSGWMNDPRLSPHITMISDADMNGFMACLKGMNKSKGLDLILHTPGGVVSATQAIGTYLRDAFEGDIRAIVPQLAMSAGTMLACACKEIVMGRHSSIGPFDPIYQGCSTFSVLREFEQARQEITENPNLAELWRPILERYPPGFVVDCRNAIQLAHKLVAEWLQTGMFLGDDRAEERAAEVTRILGSGDAMLQHDRHVSANEAREYGLRVSQLEADQELQDHVLTLHHAALYSMAARPVAKLIESSEGQQYNTARIISN